ncbi:hypothetical protein [Priestia aryabhattai]|uniref:hypothetical protein n=1 Tax=Priestia aryabhattai TaxID=412384 RepID=UPI002E235C0E|nr:hypothetical protein [Priestia aryabhattai]
MESPFEMITDVDKVENAYYIEVKPGEYNAKYWNKESVYFADEAFAYFYTTICKYVPKYEPTQVTEIKAETWLRISNQLQELAYFLSTNPPMIKLRKWIDFSKVEETYKQFDHHKNKYIRELINMIKEFTVWITKVCQTQSYITILGT